MGRSRDRGCAAVAAIMLGLSVPSVAGAQSEAPEKCLWGALDLGGTSVRDPSRDMGHLRCAACYEPSGRAFFTFAIAGNVDLHDYSLISDNSGEEFETITEYAVTVGKRAVSRRLGFASVSAGLALTVRHEPYADNHGGFGIPVDVQLVLAPFRHVGIGSRGFANWNTDRSFAGASMGLLVGRLW